ncbi:MAG: IS1595 family transposase, partial [Lysobacteraceae bacterium]
MQAASFKQWLARVKRLTRRQREQLFALLRPAVGLDQVCATIEQARSVSACPGCGGRRLHRHGHDRGVQRYRCCACDKTFSALTGTPLARLRHRGKWLDYLERMLDGQSVRKAADALGVHRNTSFRWRHRFLHLAKDDRPAALRGIAEADELFLLESQKGSRKLDRPPRKRGGVAHRRGINREHVCVLVARDRTGATFDFLTGRGAVTAAQLHRHLLPVLDRDVLL